MRTLTLGVLIATGGTLAALPFRQYQAIPDASSAPVQVTGPTKSALDPADSSLLVANDSSDSALTGDAIASSGGTQNGDAPASDSPPWQRQLPSPAPRPADAPLTYEDLALPINPPPPIARRFNATVPIRQQQLEQERMSALVMPAMEQLAVTQQIELQKVAESVQKNLFSQPNDSATAGSLASSREGNVEPHPKSSPVDRQRYWIRQPE